jgi:hypothetical protein
MSKYDDDFYAWTQDQARLLRAGDFHAVDVTHLAEEIEDLGKSQRHAVTSHLRVLMLHLLKWEHQPQRRSESWLSSIGNARAEIDGYLDDNPSLRHDLQMFVDRVYPSARRLAAVETSLSPETFPATCPWTLAQLQDLDFLPEGSVDQR